ncbi:hypothetical protein TrVE_jg4772 [Triparma verrucosa]|uniref:Uncharacterized protein n=1 Tax=Triparma verrucosa TaxID=1606542 RepID=A0A9W7BN58_9STRA|nr:hypothetical protein TrVE_jg4772 [Triparma verrucosa]
MDSVAKRRRMLALRSKSGGSSSSFSPRRPAAQRPSTADLDLPKEEEVEGTLPGGAEYTGDGGSVPPEETAAATPPVKRVPDAQKARADPRSEEVSKILFDSSSDDEEEDVKKKEEAMEMEEEEEEEDSDDREWQEMMRKPTPAPTEPEPEPEPERPELKPPPPAAPSRQNSWSALCVTFLENNNGFFVGWAFGTVVTAIALISTLSPIPTNFGTKGCALPFRAWHVKLSRVDVLVELTAHSTHIHLPFMLYVLTHSVPWTVSCIFLCEAAEWINNALKVAELHMYDDPLDDFLQGIVGLVWSMALVKSHGWTSVEKSLKLKQKVQLHAYGYFYSLTCSALMGSAWYVPRRLGLAAYTIWASAGIRWIGWFVGGVGEYHYQSVLLSLLTCCYGVVMLATEDMVSQNMSLAAFMASTVAVGPLLREDKRKTLAVKTAKTLTGLAWSTLMIFIVVSGLVWVGGELEAGGTCPSEGNIWCKVTASTRDLFNDKGEALVGVGDVYLEPIGILAGIQKI